MKAALVALALVFAPVCVIADSADVKISSFSPGSVERAGWWFYGNTFITNLGPDIARNVAVTTVVEGWPEVQLPCPGGRCAVGDVKLFASPSVPRISQRLPVRDFTFTVTITVSSDTPDPDLTNNTLTRTIRVTTAPHVSVSLTAPPFIDPGKLFELSIIVDNFGLEHAPAHDVEATLDLPDGVEPASLPSGCAATGRQVVCRIALLPAFTDYRPASFKLKLEAPPRYEGGELAFHAVVKTREENVARPYLTEVTATPFMYRTFFVTSTKDDGLGTLRTAAVGAAALCPATTACKIAFNIAEPSDAPWKTIRLFSPLPPIRAKLLIIDGATQTEYAGTKNPDGPPIEISGGGTVAGDGLVLASLQRATIANLTINGFRGNGITLDGGDGVTIRGNYIGTDPTGSFARPNDRGIGMSMSRSSSFLPGITDNVISGNDRSGIFVLRGAYVIARNRIGLEAHRDEPLPNGGSGIYFGQDAWRMEVFENTIAFNREMGIAVHPLASHVWMHANSVYANGGLAVDDGLDGPSRVVSAPPSTSPARDTIGVPILLEAVYDPVTNRTTLRMSASMLDDYEIFVSDTPGDAQRPVAEGTVILPGSLKPLEVALAGDLRGKWLTATATRFYSHTALDIYRIARTTEISNAVQVR